MLKRTHFSTSLSPAAMIVALLALLLATAGVGYTAATIGTSDLQNDAVTSPKVKDRTLKAADMVRERKFTYVGTSGAPNFKSGGQGDCIWSSAHNQLPGVARVGFRIDRFGTVHLSGVAVGVDGPGGDATCDSVTQQEDGIVFTLPRKARPAKTQLHPIGDQGTLIVAGKNGLFVPPSIALPPGTVFWAGSPGFGALIDSFSFPAAGTTVYGRSSATGKVTPPSRQLLRGLGLR